MSDGAMTVRVLVGDGDRSATIAQATTYPEGVGDITIDWDTPRLVARVGISALENICLGLRQVASGDADGIGVSVLSFDERMRPVATGAQVDAVAVILAGVFDNLTDTPADTPDEAYVKLDDQGRAELTRLARFLLDVAREAGD